MSSSTASPAPAKSAAGRKSTKAATPAASTSTAPAPAPAPAPVVVAPVPAPAPIAATPSVPAVVEVSHEEVNLASRVTALAEKVNNLRTAMASIYSEVKVLEKAVPRELKKAQKGGRRARKTTEGGEDKPKKETVFTRPTPISDALCTFLGLAKGTLISRSEVTSRVCKYAKDKGLMEKKAIKADGALRKLLQLKEGDELKILNLQRYLKIHYPKAAVAIATA